MCFFLCLLTIKLSEFNYIVNYLGMDSFPILFSCGVLFCSAERDGPCFHSFGFEAKELKHEGEVGEEEQNRESPEGQGGRPDALCRAKASVIQIWSCSGATAHSRFLSSFHPHPHLFLLLLIGSDWIWPTDAKHTQHPAQGLRAETCNIAML